MLLITLLNAQGQAIGMFPSSVRRSETELIILRGNGFEPADETSHVWRNSKTGHSAELTETPNLPPTETARKIKAMLG